MASFEENQQRAKQTEGNRYLKIEFWYFISCLISLPFESTAFEMFIVARNEVVKIQVDDCPRCLPGQT